MRHDYLVNGTEGQARRPGFVQWIGYLYGAALPESLSAWVLHHLTGPGATRRYLLRFLVPVIPAL